MPKRKSYNGGSSVKNTMTFGKEKYLEERIRQRVKGERTKKAEFEKQLEEWYKNPPPDKLIKKNITE